MTNIDHLIPVLHDDLTSDAALKELWAKTDAAFKHLSAPRPGKPRGGFTSLDMIRFALEHPETALAIMVHYSRAAIAAGDTELDWFDDMVAEGDRRYRETLQ
jgi:hypothetical protein